LARKTSKKMLGFLGSLHFPTGALTQQGSAPSDRGVESVNGKSEIKKGWQFKPCAHQILCHRVYILCPRSSPKEWQKVDRESKVP
jgi:hypothetical protein